MENPQELVLSNPIGPETKAQEIVVGTHEIGPAGPQEIASLETSVHELVLCQVIFDSWMAELNRVSEETQEAFEAQLRAAIAALQTRCARSVDAAHNIVSSYKVLSSVMARRMRRAAEATDGRLAPSDHVIETTDTFTRHADSLSTHVEGMRADLKSLVASLEYVKKTPCLWQRFWIWLRTCFAAMARVLANVRVIAAVSFNPKTSKLESVVGTVFLDLENLGGSRNDEVTFARVLRLLATTIPEQAKIAKNCLIRVQGCQIALQLEMHLRAGLSIRISFDDAEEAGDQWQLQLARLQLITKKVPAT